MVINTYATDIYTSEYQSCLLYCEAVIISLNLMLATVAEEIRNINCNRCMMKKDCQKE